MTIGYKHKFKDGTPTYFSGKIILGIKVHTIRKDPHNRWLEGKIIHHCYYNRTHKRCCFLMNQCLSTQNIKITWSFIDYLSGTPLVLVNGITMSPEQIELIAHNDGFKSSSHFFSWFDHDFNGKIIHWTKLKY